MKNKFYSLIITMVIAIVLTGCDNANTPPALFTNGVFVINEGSFGNSNAEVSFINSDNSVNNNLYANNNSGLVLGDVLQSMHIANSNAYLIVNNSDKIEVVDINNFASKTTIGALKMPRYMVSYNGRGYVSEYVSYTGNGNIKIIDLASNAIVDSVQVGMQPENLLVVGNSILVTNSGDTTVHLINTSTLALTNIGDIDCPKYVTQTSDGNIWILYTGYFGSTDGGLLVLNSTATSIVKNITIGHTAFQNPSQLCTDGNNLYYEYQGNVYKLDKAATVAPAGPFITSPATYLYGLNYYAASNTLYVADAKNFVSSGMVKRYNATSGAALDSVNAGIAPNGFIFN